MERVAIKSGVRFRFDGKSGVGITSYISEKGILVHSPSIPPQESLIFLTLERFDGGNDIDCMARVHKIFEPPKNVSGFLVEIEHIDPMNLHRIREFIKKRSGSHSVNAKDRADKKSDTDFDRYLMMKEMEKIAKEYEIEEASKNNVQERIEKEVTREAISGRKLVFKTLSISLVVIIVGFLLYLFIEPILSFFFKGGELIR